LAPRTVIHAEERETPRSRKKIEWKLITDLPVGSRQEAIEKLEWYAMRWKIEVFHKILKSGCKAEESKLRTAERLVNLISVFCILSWRVFWMTMINRSAPEAPPSIVLTRTEIELLDRLVTDRGKVLPRRKTIGTYLTKIARLGGYLARATDPPPGNMVMWVIERVGSPLPLASLFWLQGRYQARSAASDGSISERPRSGGRRCYHC
jgi:ribosomal protein S18